MKTNKEITWEASRFNAQTLVEDGSLVLYNSYTGAIASFPPTEADVIRQWLKKPVPQQQNLSIHQELFTHMIRQGFLVPNHVDEKRRALFLHQSMHRADLMHLILLVTEACNFRCEYCYESFPRGSMTKEAISGLKTYVDEKARTLRELTVSWHGGEPLLVPHILEELSLSFIESARKHGAAYNAEMSTNGYFLTKEQFEKLLSWKVQRFMVTLDGPADVHNHRRGLNGGRATYERIIGNLLSLKEVAAPFEINLRVNFDNSNLEAVEQFIPVLSELFADDDRFAVYFRPVGCMGGENDLNLPVCDERTKDQKIWEFNQKATASGLALSSFISDILMPTAAVCYAAKPNSMIVVSDGKLYKCSVALDEEYNQIGRLYKDGTADIDYDKIALWVTSGEDQDENCQACFFRPSCQGNHCPLYRMRTGNRPCSYEKRQIKKTLQAIWKASAGC